MRATRVLWLLLIAWFCGPGVWGTNVVFNAGFDTDVAGWTAEVNVTVFWSPNDANADTGSGSAEVTNTHEAPQQGVGILQCLDITPVAGVAYDFGGQVYIPDGQTRTGSGQIGLRWLAGLGCTGATVGPQPRREAVALGTWVELSAEDQIAPAGAASVLFLAFPSKVEAGGSLVARFDDLTFGQAVILEDGFESGDTRAWSDSSPAIISLTPYVDINQIASLGRVYCDSGDCPWEPPTQLHDGLDFMPAEDLVPFRAVAPGVVVDVDPRANSQVNVIVDYARDATHLLVYAFEPMMDVGNDQLDQITVQIGSQVVAGDVLGFLVRADLNAAHLHFGFIEDHVQVCPEPFLATAVEMELLDLIHQADPTLGICE